MPSRSSATQAGQGQDVTTPGMPHNPNGQRPKLGKVERERNSLQRELRRLAVLFEALVQTRRWRIGNAIGDFVEKLPGRHAGPKAIDEIAGILGPFRGVTAGARAKPRRNARRDEKVVLLSHFCNHLPRLIRTRRWRLGRSLFALPRRVQGRDPRATERRILKMVREGRALLENDQMRGHRADILLWELSKDAEGLLRSREWRVGKTVGDSVERLFHLPTDEKSEQKILAKG